MAGLSCAAVALPSFTGLRANATPKTGGAAKVAVSPTPVAVVGARASLKKVGAAVVATTLGTILATNALATDVLLGGSSGSMPSNFAASPREMVFDKDAGVSHNVVFEDSLLHKEESGRPRGRPYNMIFHPPTGLCVLRKSLTEPLQLGSCAESEPWKYSPQQILFLKGTYFCMQADGLGKPAKLGIMCTDPGSNWDVISDGNMHLSSNLVDGTAVCLDVDSNNNIVTNSCKYSSEDHTPDSASQWFEIVRNSKTQLPLPVRNSPLNPLHPEEQIQSERDVRHGEEGLSNQ